MRKSGNAFLCQFSFVLCPLARVHVSALAMLVDKEEIAGIHKHTAAFLSAGLNSGLIWV